MKVEGELKGLFDGPLLGVSQGSSLTFYSWEKGAKLVTLPLAPHSLYWQNQTVVIL
jgi:hypothetical protein